MERVVLLVVVFFASSVQAETRAEYEDAIVSQRSELIVIGTLRHDSIQYQQHNRKAGDGASWEHHGVLIITEVLKGRIAQKDLIDQENKEGIDQENKEGELGRLPIVLHYGLTPVVGGKVNRPTFGINIRGSDDSYPADRVDIVDTAGNSMEPLENVGAKPHIWFLRKKIRRIGGQPDLGRFGIVDPEDVQSVDLRHYFLGYLSDDPEHVLRTLIKKQPKLAARTQSYLDHCAVQRAIAIKDPRERVEKLTPYFLKRTQWQMKSEAADAIAASGKSGGEKLLVIFDDPQYVHLRQTIILMWRDMNYEPVGKMLIGLLEEHDKFWAEQELGEDWWNAQGDLAERRRQIYGEVYYGVCTLRTLDNPDARAVIKLTHDRWKQINFSNDQIVEECERALAQP